MLRCPPEEAIFCIKSTILYISITNINDVSIEEDNNLRMQCR